MRDWLYEETGLQQREVVIILLSLLIGGGLLTGNFLYYQEQQDQFTMTYEENPDALTVSTQNPARFAFQLEQPEQMNGASIELAFQSVDNEVTITPTVNGRTYEAREGIVSGATHTVHIQAADLREVNEVVVEGEFSLPGEAAIGSVTVTGVTGSQRMTFLLLNVVGMLTILGPILVIKYRQYSRRHELERQFPNFLRDVVEGTRAGMSLPQAIKNTKTNNYGELTPYVEEMAAKLEWGIPFEHVMEDFAKQTSSQVVQRSVSTIIQTYRAGGNVSNVLETIGNNLNEIRRLRKERESQIYGELVTGYIVFFVFLLVLVVLVRYLLPSLTFAGGGTGLGAVDVGGLSAEEMTQKYRPIFQWLIIIQAVFSGMVIGRLSEGELKAGGKHVAVLLGIGYTVAVVLM